LSFQFIGFPSEWGGDHEALGGLLEGGPVSNLLGSPASGEYNRLAFHPDRFIPFPIYWVPQRVGSQRLLDHWQIFNEFPIYWVPQRVGSQTVVSLLMQALKVSNLLGSPASGESYMYTAKIITPSGFPIYWVPQRVGSQTVVSLLMQALKVSNLLGSPASGELDVIAGG